MAQRNVTVMVDDLTGAEISRGSGETVRFSIDGDTYEIDLESSSAQKLRATIAEFATAGRRIPPNRSSAPRPKPVATAPDPAAVRAWAAARGIKVSDRGRIPAAVVEQFQAAGN